MKSDTATDVWVRFWVNYIWYQPQPPRSGQVFFSRNHWWCWLHTIIVQFRLGGRVYLVANNFSCLGPYIFLPCLIVFGLFLPTRWQSVMRILPWCNWRRNFGLTKLWEGNTIPRLFKLLWKQVYALHQISGPPCYTETNLTNPTCSLSLIR